MTSDLKKFAAELRKDAPKLDLHGRDPYETESKIDQFLYDQFTRDESSAEIIYGIGKGILGEKTRKFLQSHPLVEKVVDKGGYCVVLLGGKN